MESVFLKVEDDSYIAELLNQVVDFFGHKVGAIATGSVAQAKLVLMLNADKANGHGAEAFVVNHDGEGDSQTL